MLESREPSSLEQKHTRHTVRVCFSVYRLQLWSKQAGGVFVWINMLLKALNYSNRDDTAAVNSNVKTQDADVKLHHSSIFI